jgi:hypothetical protein
MDIFIETHLKINQDIQPDVDTLDTDQLIALRESLKTSEEMVSELTARARSLELIMSDYKNMITRRINRLESERRELAAAESGYTIGSYHYIDRHVGIYKVKEVNGSRIIMEQHKEGSNWPTTKRFDIGNMDQRMTPLRGQGPFRVGETVVRNEREYTVIGYLGYRMVLRFTNEWGRDEHIIVQKKDEKTYRSLII